MMYATIGQPAGTTDTFYYDTGPFTLVRETPTLLTFRATITSGRFAGETTLFQSFGAFDTDAGTGFITTERELVRGEVHFSLRFDSVVSLENFDVDLEAAAASGVIFRGNGFSNVGWGDVGNDRLYGGGGDDLLYAYGGTDRLDGGAGADLMTGGAGNDTYYFDNVGDSAVETARGGRDLVYSSVSITGLCPNVEWLTLTGTEDLNGIGNASDNVLRGTTGDNLLGGAGGNDTLYGLRGNDRLNGGAGADVMEGGPGNDTYWVDTARDTVREYSDGGTDTIISTVSFALLTEVEKLSLAGSAGINGVGNALDNVLRGNSGDNRLDGGAGADTMIGGAGDDIYWVDTALDEVIEAVGRGTDTVVAGLSHALAANVENLSLAGSTDINGIGNVLANVLRGNEGDNKLDGGAGADTMIGGAGDDIYWVDAPGDRVTEAAGRGTDAIVSTVTRALPDNVENLRLAGSDAIDGSGNALDNEILGNAAANRLRGGAGEDELRGGPGADALVGGPGADELFGGQDADVFVFARLSDSGLGAAADVIGDFASGTDLVDVSAIDADPGTPGDQPFVFIGADPFTGIPGEIRAVAGLAAADTDGDGIADMEIIFANGVTPVAGDFLL